MQPALIIPFLSLVLLSFPAMAQTKTVDVQVRVISEIVSIELDGTCTQDGQDECDSVEVENADPYDVIVNY
jgi:hypothetical protein